MCPCNSKGEALGKPNLQTSYIRWTYYKTYYYIISPMRRPFRCIPGVRGNGFTFPWKVSKRKPSSFPPTKTSLRLLRLYLPCFPFFHLPSVLPSFQFLSLLLEPPSDQPPTLLGPALRSNLPYWIGGSATLPIYESPTLKAQYIFGSFIANL